MVTRYLSFACILMVLFAGIWLSGCRAKQNNGNRAGQSNRTTSSDGTPDSGSELTAVPPKQHVKHDESLTRAGIAPAKNDTLMRYYGSDPDTLNLITSNDATSSNFQRQVYGNLAQRRFGDPSVWDKDLAVDWEVKYDEKNNDAPEYIIKLRKGVKWHPITFPEGKTVVDQEFTAHDVKFTFDCILNPYIEAASLRSYYVTKDPKTGESKPRIIVKVIDDYTISVKWTEPYFMADEFTIGGTVMPRHVYGNDKRGEPISFDVKSKEFADGFNNHWANSTMCGTGPLIFKEWKRNVQVTLERNPNYHGNPFYFDKVVYQHISNPNTVRNKVLQNDLDIASYSEANQYIQDQSHKNVKSSKVVLKHFRRTAYRYLGYNVRRPMFEHRNVRMALSHAVPVDNIIKSVYHGLAVRQTGPFLPGGKFCNNDIKPVPFNLKKAKSLLDEAGWVDSNENGIRDKMIDGELVEFQFELMIYADSPQYLSISKIIQEQFRKIGVKMQITPAKWALMLQRLRKKNFDATILGWVSDWKSDPYQIWHGSQAELPESSNSIGYSNPEVDKLIDKLRVTMKEEDQVKYYYDIHRLIYEDQPYTFLYLDKAMIGVHSRLENLNFYPMLRPHMDTREWYSSRPRAMPAN